MNDSKKLSAKKRDLLFEQIKEEAVAWGVSMVDESVIDEINILNATLQAMTFTSDYKPVPLQK